MALSLKALKGHLNNLPNITDDLAGYPTMKDMSFEEKLVLGFEQNTSSPCWSLEYDDTVYVICVAYILQPSSTMLFYLITVVSSHR